MSEPCYKSVSEVRSESGASSVSLRVSEPIMLNVSFEESELCRGSVSKCQNEPRFKSVPARKSESGKKNVSFVASEPV